MRRLRKGRKWGRGRLRGVIAVLTIGSMLLLAAPALAGGTDAGARGKCSGDSVWRLRLHEADRVIGVGFRVHSGVEGELWKVRIAQNRHLIFAGRRVTNEKGSFGVRLKTRNTEGVDLFRAGAVNVETGEVCRGRAAI